MTTPTQQAYRATIEAAIAYLASVGLTPLQVHAAEIALREAAMASDQSRTIDELAAEDGYLELWEEEHDRLEDEADEQQAALGL